MLRDLNAFARRGIIAGLALDDRVKIPDHRTSDDAHKTDAQALPDDHWRNPSADDRVEHPHDGGNL